MSWTDWTSGDWLGKWKPPWPPSPARLPEAMAESMSRLVDVFGFSPAGFLHNIVSTASASLIGRQLETTIGGQAVRFVLNALRIDPPQYGPLVGQFGEILVQVRDVSWRDRRIDELRVRAENVHLQPGVTTTLVSAPVVLSATIDQPEIASMLAQTQPAVVVRLADGVATAALAGRESWGHVEIMPTVRDDVVRLKPVSLNVRGRRLERIARLIPAVEVRLPAAPRNGRFTDVVVEGDRLRR